MNEYKGKSITINDTTYILNDEIDQGGNSSVYNATVPNDPRVFAIKILQTTKSKEKKERFLKEIGFCENVTHPNIVPIYGHGEIEKHLCYVKDIHFSADEILKDIYFQELAYHYCWRKFVYEAQVYRRGGNYTPLNLDDPAEKELYHSFETIVKRHHNEHIRNNLTNELLKIFASCCNYHCEELFSKIKALEKELSDFDDAPIMYIVYRLRHTLEQHRVKDIDLAETISINWNTTEYDDSVEPSLFREEIDKSETDVMAVFQSNWDIVYRKIDDSHYLVRFNSRENFDNFKKHALALSAPHYVFEGDVQYILSNPQHYGNMVELRPLSSFDITNTIARIFGIRAE